MRKVKRWTDGGGNPSPFADRLDDLIIRLAKAHRLNGHWVCRFLFDKP